MLAGHNETPFKPKYLIMPGNENDSTSVLFEIYALSEFYAARNGSSVLTFWQSLLVPSSKVKDLGLLDL
jgi:hypothetical protein